MGIFDNGNLVTALDENYNCDPRGRAAHDLNWYERQLVEDLNGIVARAQRLLDALAKPETAWNAIHDIAQGAGASGPIGSMWEKTVALAAKVSVIGEYGVDHRPAPETVDA